MNCNCPRYFSCDWCLSMLYVVLEHEIVAVIETQISKVGLLQFSNFTMTAVDNEGRF